jgi:16S rRNA (guanine966-N2)-methyltransferase
MRVIAGSRRSLPLKTPKTMATRPTADRIKETLFNILNPYLPGARFLDLFAGSGGIGIEALSRGASKAVFVEKGRDAIAVIRENLAFTKFTDVGTLIPKDVFTAIPELEAAEEHFDIVFLDPPYGTGVDAETLKRLLVSSLIGDETLIVLETSIEADPRSYSELGYLVERDKTYKTNRHLFLRKRTTV